ncbi:MAG: hypothetical protein QF787_16745, partial [Nitrospinota bacterium]|nr:hypothetical protein [Nitrospinota bacterium]
NSSLSPPFTLMAIFRNPSCPITQTLLENGFGSFHIIEQGRRPVSPQAPIPHIFDSCPSCILPNVNVELDIHYGI